MTVPMNDFQRLWSQVGAAVSGAVDRVGASGWYILGNEVSRFEQALARAWGVSHAVGVNSGMDAIEIALRCAGLQPGDRVLTTPLSAFATTLAITRCGGIPVFADVNEQGLLDLDRCRRLLERRFDLRFLLPVHLFGRCLDLDQLRDLRDRFHLQVVEDCAQSIGARWGETAAGTVGQIAATSFYPTKNLGALGDGGAVLTGSPALAETARALRHYGQTATYRHELAGLNSRLDELQAAILHDAMLPALAAWTGQRQATARAYRDGITNPRLTLPAVAAPEVPVWHLFPVLAPPGRRQALADHLRAAGVASGLHYPALIPDQPAMAGLALERTDELVMARRITECELSLPIHAFLTSDEITRVLDALNRWEG